MVSPACPPLGPSVSTSAEQRVLAFLIDEIFVLPAWKPFFLLQVFVLCRCEYAEIGEVKQVFASVLTIPVRSPLESGWERGGEE